VITDAALRAGIEAFTNDLSTLVKQAALAASASLL